MTIKKKLLSVLLSLVMALQVGAVALPVYADDIADTETNTETDNLEYKLQAIRNETNLLANGNLEEEFSVANYPTTGGYSLKYANYSATAIGYEISDEKYYSEGKSLFQSKTNGGDERVIATANVRKGATYIASVMALGSEANADHWNNNTLKNNATYQPKIALKIEPLAITDGTATWVNSDVEMADVKNVSIFPAGDFITGTEWKRLHNTVIVKDSAASITALGVSVNVGLQCSGQNPDYNYMELYTDDYYLGELMVADIQTPAIAEIPKPVLGGAAETVELTASAVNQIGTTDGLEDAEFYWSLTAGEVEGVSIEDNVLTVTDEAQGGELSLTVECVPSFTGADDQSEAITRYRTKEVIVTIKELTEEEKKAAFLKSTNLVDNGDVEIDMVFDSNSNVAAGAAGQWMVKENDAEVEITAEQSTNQAYSGTKSVLVKKGGTKSQWGMFSPVILKSKMKANTTYIANLKILGTQKNANEGWATVQHKDTQWENKLNFLAYADTFSWAFTSPHVYRVKELADAPYSNAADQGAPLDKSYWKDLTATIKTEGSLKSVYGFGIGTLDYNQEFYTDDYYMGELVVYNVENKTSMSSVQIPTGSENAELELKAEAYNQLGNQIGLEGSNFEWVIADEDAYGVSIEDGKLIVTNNANVRALNLTATCVPTFLGADTQTEAQKARRTITVPIELTAAPGASEAPQAKEIKLTGTVTLNETLTLSYKYWQLYNVAEGDTEITWYRSENADGPWEAFNEGNLTYKLEQEGEDDLYYRAEVKPVSEDEIEGAVAKTATLCKPVAPVASNVKVKGIQAIDEEWEVVSYDYYDKNGDAKDEPIYQWFVSATGKIEDGTEIAGATEKTYKITEAEAEKYVYVGVKAVSKVAPEVAEDFAYSEPMLTSAVPSVSGVKIEKESSNLVKVKYNYSHPLKIAEGETVVEWYNGNELLGKGTSLNISKLKGEKIEVRVTPMAEKKPYEGATVTADYEISFGSSSVGGSPVSGGGGGGGAVVKPAPKPEIQNVPTWAKTEIDYVLKNNIMEVAAENDFGGSNKINRGEFMMAMLKAAGISPSDYRGSFADVTSLDKYSGYLQSAFDQGVIAAADNFYPARELTRDEMCKIIVTSIEAMTKKEISKSAINHFTDYSNIQAWAIDFISQAVSTGIIKGNADGSVNPKGNVTRAEAAVVAKRIVEYVKAEGGLK